MIDETTAAPDTEQPQMSLVLTPGKDVMVVTQSEVDLFDSEKAQEIRDFDDSTLLIMSPSGLTQDMRLSRGRAPQLALISDLYVVPGLNARLPTPEWDAHIEWLTGQIMEHGFRDDCPLLVFPTKDEKGTPVYGIISGESRYRAVMRANKRGLRIESIPAILAPEGMSAEEMCIQVATSNGGKEFTPLEQSHLALRFSKFGRTPAEIAKIFKVSSSHVSQLLLISRAPNKVRSMLAEGTVSFQVAVDAMKKDPTKAVAMLEEDLKKTGGKKLTRQHTKDHQIQKAVRANAPKMQDLLSKLTQDKGSFELLDEEFQKAILSVLSDIEEAASKTPEDLAKERAAKKAEVAAAKKVAAAAKKAATAEKKAAAAKNKPTAAKKTTKSTASKPTKDKAPGTEVNAAPTTAAKKTLSVAAKKPAQTAAATRTTSAVTRVRTGDVQQHPDE